MCFVDTGRCVMAARRDHGRRRGPHQYPTTIYRLTSTLLTWDTIIDNSLLVIVSYFLIATTEPSKGYQMEYLYE